MIQSINKGTIGSRLAIPALLLVPFAVIAHRFGWLNFQLASALLALSLLLSLVIMICSAVAHIRSDNPAFRANMRTTFLISSVLPLLILGFIIKSASSGNLPIIHDITTDTVNVPQFKAAVALRGSESNSLAIDQDVIAQQIAAYPNVKTLYSTLPPEQAFARALEVAEQLGWVIYHRGVENGQIEAYEKTLIWGFIDDVVIRIIPDENGSAVDLRSVSRVGGGDIGANAARISQFIDAF